MKYENAREWGRTAAINHFCASGRKHFQFWNGPSAEILQRLEVQDEDREAFIEGWIVFTQHAATHIDNREMRQCIDRELVVKQMLSVGLTPPYHGMDDIDENGVSYFDYLIGHEAIMVLDAYREGRKNHTLTDEQIKEAYAVAMALDFDEIERQYRLYWDTKLFGE